MCALTPTCQAQTCLNPPPCPHPSSVAVAVVRDWARRAGPARKAAERAARSARARARTPALICSMLEPQPTSVLPGPVAKKLESA